jgi:hypothetical protein
MKPVTIAFWGVAVASAVFLGVVGMYTFGHTSLYLACGVVLLLAWLVVGRWHRASSRAGATDTPSVHPQRVEHALTREAASLLQTDRHPRLPRDNPQMLFNVARHRSRFDDSGT